MVPKATRSEKRLLRRRGAGFGNGGCRGCKRPVRENPSGEVMVELTLKGREEADLVKRRKNK